MANPNLSKLNAQFNMKNIDAAGLTKALSEHQNSLIKIVLIVGTLIVVGLMYNDHRVKSQGIHAKMSQAQDKLDAIKAHETAAQDLSNFKSSLPQKINEFELIRLISNYAKSCHVSIPSLSPGESKDMGLYNSIDVNFNAESDNFKDMMLFLRKIERSKFSLRINSWSGHEADNEKITFVIQISAVLIHT